MNVRFVVVAPESKKGTFHVRLPIVVGRSEEAKFRIQQDRVSRKHCEFFAKGDEVFVRDLGSTNGTFLDDEQVETSVKTPVAPGAVVRVGSLAFRVEYGAASGTRTTEVRPALRDESDVTVGVKHAGDSQRLKIEHADDAAAEAGEPGDEIPDAEFREEESEAPSAEAADDAAAESGGAASESMPEETEAEPAAAQAEPTREEPKKKPAGKGFDFLDAEPAADEGAAESPHWPGDDAEAESGPPDDEKLGDFFKGLK